MPSGITFSPATPLPFLLDVRTRINQLRAFLNPEDPWYEREAQHVNIRALIELYENGILDGTKTTYISEGKVITKAEFDRATTWCIIDVSWDPSFHGSVTDQGYA